MVHNEFNSSLDTFLASLPTRFKDSFLLSDLHKPKKQKTVQVSPVAIGHVNTRIGKPRVKRVKILLDSGTSSSIILHKYVKNLRQNDTAATIWQTQGGQFITTKRCKVHFSLPEFFDNRLIHWNFHVANTTTPANSYDMIIGRDIMTELGITLDFNLLVMTWDNATVLMRSADALSTEDAYVIYNETYESDIVQEATTRLRSILDAKYEPANLDKITASCSYLDATQQSSLNDLLQRYRHLFDGTLGTWRSTPYAIQLRENVQPYHAKPFPIPRIHEQTLKVELQRLCDIGVLRRINHSEWAAPTFVIPKKDGLVRFISDFRKLNKRIRRQPYPIPHIQDLLLKLEGFQYATSLDLNMGYYHITLTPFSKRLCTIVTPFGKYEYQRLPMGLSNSPDIFQEKISELMIGLDFVRAYIDDILVISSGSWDDHLYKLDTVFSRLSTAGLKVNAKKSFFGKLELEYLGFWITCHGIRPVAKKVEAFLNIAPPTTRKELRRFIGLINYYRDMWIHRSDTLAPLTALTSRNVPWRWTEVKQKAFNAMKRIISRETLLSYPDFTAPFDIHTDASDLQLGAVILQRGKPIAFYSRKLNSAQQRYTVGKRELLSVVETLKTFCNILLGQPLNVYTNHLNLTYKTCTTDRVLRWRLLLEEYNPTFHYISGKRNIVADALSRLPRISSSIENEQSYTLQILAECFGTDANNLPSTAFPLRYASIAKAQHADTTLLRKLDQPHASLHRKTFCGGGKSYDLICHNDQIVIPRGLRARVIEWYHQYLLHPGVNRTEETIRQHLWWSKMRNDIVTYVTKCPTCQQNKKHYNQKQYGLLPEKEAEANPWDKLCVDLIGPYTIQRKGKAPLKLQCCTMIDPATGWFEIAQYDDKRSITIANIVEQSWLSWYPWPTQIVFDRGSEFIGHEFLNMIRDDYGIKRNLSLPEIQQANAV